MGASLTKEEKFVWYVVCPQSFSGLAMSGLFYGWGALNGEEIILRILRTTFHEYIVAKSVALEWLKM